MSTGVINVNTKVFLFNLNILFLRFRQNRNRNRRRMNPPLTFRNRDTLNSMYSAFKLHFSERVISRQLKNHFLNPTRFV